MDICPRFHVVLQVQHSQTNRTTCPATHCCLVWSTIKQGIAYLIKQGIAYFVTIIPPMKIHVIPLACKYFGFNMLYIGVLLVLVSFMTHVVCVVSHCRHVKRIRLRVCCYLSLITTFYLEQGYYSGSIVKRIDYFNISNFSSKNSKMNAHSPYCARLKYLNNK